MYRSSLEYIDESFQGWNTAVSCLDITASLARRETKEDMHASQRSWPIKYKTFGSIKSLTQIWSKRFLKLLNTEPGDELEEATSKLLPLKTWSVLSILNFFRFSKS